MYGKILKNKIDYNYRFKVVDDCKDAGVNGFFTYELQIKVLDKWLIGIGFKGKYVMLNYF